MRPGATAALALGALAFAAPRAASQPNEVVVPASYENQEAPGTVFWALSPFEARRQLMLDVSHLGPARQQTLRALDLRRNGAVSRTYAASLVQLQVILSHSPRTADTASTSFAANRGGDATTVFSGVVALPFSPPVASTPARWSPPQGIAIVFQQPFAYGGGTLCIETVTTTAPGNPNLPPPWWPVDAYVERSGGAVSLLGVSCLAGTRPGADPRSLVLGSSASLHLRGSLAAGTGGVCMLGTSATRFGILALPFDRSPGGAPGCWVNSELLVGLPATAVALPNSSSALATVSFRLPILPSLAGQNVYGQWLWGTTTNALGIAFTESVQATLAPPAQLAGASWVESVDLASPAGEVLRGRIPVLRLRF